LVKLLEADEAGFNQISTSRSTGASTAANKEYAKKHYNWEAIFQQTTDAYQHILSSIAKKVSN
jgi:hypothetical protein